MSRGLGALQKAILRELRKAKAALSAGELAYRIQAGRTGREFFDVPRALVVAVRRAIHALAQRGKAVAETVRGRVGRKGSWDGETLTYVLTCRLKSHAPRKFKAPGPPPGLPPQLAERWRGMDADEARDFHTRPGVKGSAVEALVLQVLASADEAEIEDYVEHDARPRERSCGLDRRPGWVPYSWLRKTVLERLGAEGKSWAEAACTRAVQRLYRRYKVRIGEDSPYALTHWTRKIRWLWLEKGELRVAL
jgi:hypothetical protein